MNESPSQTETDDGRSAGSHAGTIAHRRPPGRSRIGHERPWGIRASYGLTRAVATILRDANQPLPRHEVARRIGGRQAAAEIGLITLGHLGFVQRTGGQARLTPAGDRYVMGIGTKQEAEALARGLLNHEPFERVWTRVLAGGKVQRVARKSLIQALRNEGYHYSEQTTENIASHTLAFAREAGLCFRTGAGSDYALNPQRFFELTKGPPSSALGESRTRATASRRAAGKITTGRLGSELDELTSWLAWALADERVFRDFHRRERIQRLVAGVSERLRESPWSELIHLARDLLLHAFETNDPDFLRWAIRALRGIVDADATTPKEPS
jgi:hypothetical protein